MLTYIVTANWTDQGIRAVKDFPQRVKAARELAKRLGVELKHVFMTSGECDLVAILETEKGDNVARFMLALGGRGNLRTRTMRAWTETEAAKLIADLP